MSLPDKLSGSGAAAAKIGISTEKQVPGIHAASVEATIVQVVPAVKTVVTTAPSFVEEGGTALPLGISATPASFASPAVTELTNPAESIDALTSPISIADGNTRARVAFPPTAHADHTLHTAADSSNAVLLDAAYKSFVNAVAGSPQQGLQDNGDATDAAITVQQAATLPDDVARTTKAASGGVPPRVPGHGETLNDDNGAERPFHQVAEMIVKTAVGRPDQTLQQRTEANITSINQAVNGGRHETLYYPASGSSLEVLRTFVAYDPSHLIAIDIDGEKFSALERQLGAIGIESTVEVSDDGRTRVLNFELDGRQRKITAVADDARRLSPVDFGMQQVDILHIYAPTGAHIVFPGEEGALEPVVARLTPSNYAMVAEGGFFAFGESSLGQYYQIPPILTEIVGLEEKEITSRHPSTVLSSHAFDHLAQETTGYIFQKVSTINSRVLEIFNEAVYTNSIGLNTSVALFEKGEWDGLHVNKENGMDVQAGVTEIYAHAQQSIHAHAQAFAEAGVAPDLVARYSTETLEAFRNNLIGLQQQFVKLLDTYKTASKQYFESEKTEKDENRFLEALGVVKVERHGREELVDTKWQLATKLLLSDKKTFGDIVTMMRKFIGTDLETAFLRGEIQGKVQAAYEAYETSKSMGPQEKTDADPNAYRQYLAGLADEEFIHPDSLITDTENLPATMILANSVEELRLILEAINVHPDLAAFSRPQEEILKRVTHEGQHGEYSEKIGFAKVQWIFAMNENGPHGQYGNIYCIANGPTKPISKLAFAAHYAAPGDGPEDAIANPSPGDIKFLEDMGYGGEVGGVVVSAIEDVGNRIVAHNRLHPEDLLPLPRSYSKYADFGAVSEGNPDTMAPAKGDRGRPSIRPEDEVLNREGRDNIWGTGNPSEFQRTPWLDHAIAQIDALPHGEKLEFQIPPGTDFRFFIAMLGRSQRSHEVGGVVDPTTGIIKIKRGFADDEAGKGVVAHFEVIQPNVKEYHRIDDVMFHTHPPLIEPRLNRIPWPSHAAAVASDTDINTVLATKMIEVQEGVERPVISIVSSQGYLHVMEAQGVQFSENELQSLGLNDQQILWVKRRLALAPPEGVASKAQAGKEEALLTLVSDFYDKRLDGEGYFTNKFAAFTAAMHSLVSDEEAFEYIKTNIFGHLPEFASETELWNNGFLPEHIPVIQRMFGLRHAIYEATDNGLQEVMNADTHWQWKLPASAEAKIELPKTAYQERMALLESGDLIGQLRDFLTKQDLQHNDRRYLTIRGGLEVLVRYLKRGFGQPVLEIRNVEGLNAVGEPDISIEALAQWEAFISIITDPEFDGRNVYSGVVVSGEADNRISQWCKEHAWKKVYPIDYGRNIPNSYMFVDASPASLESTQAVGEVQQSEEYSQADQLSPPRIKERFMETGLADTLFTWLNTQPERISWNMDELRFSVESRRTNPDASRPWRSEWQTEVIIAYDRIRRGYANNEIRRVLRLDGDTLRIGTTNIRLTYEQGTLIRELGQAARSIGQVGDGDLIQQDRENRGVGQRIAGNHDLGPGSATPPGGNTPEGPLKEQKMNHLKK